MFPVGFITFGDEFFNHVCFDVLQGVGCVCIEDMKNDGQPVVVFTGQGILFYQYLCFGPLALEGQSGGTFFLRIVWRYGYCNVICIITIGLVGLAPVRCAGYLPSGVAVNG